FEPGGNGTFDYWGPIEMQNVSSLVIDVYSASGAAVFHHTQQAPAGESFGPSLLVWDGTLNGNLVPDGWYYYVVGAGGCSGAATHTGYLFLNGEYRLGCARLRRALRSPHEQAAPARRGGRARLDRRGELPLRLLRRDHRRTAGPLRRHEPAVRRGLPRVLLAERGVRRLRRGRLGPRLEPTRVRAGGARCAV